MVPKPVTIVTTNPPLALSTPKLRSRLYRAKPTRVVCRLTASDKLDDPRRMAAPRYLSAALRLEYGRRKASHRPTPDLGRERIAERRQYRGEGSYGAEVLLEP